MVVLLFSGVMTVQTLQAAPAFAETRYSTWYPRIVDPPVCEGACQFSDTVPFSVDGAAVSPVTALVALTARRVTVAAAP